MYQGLETQAGGREKVFSPFPPAGDAQGPGLERTWHIPSDGPTAEAVG